jgi:hypothetical protein
LSLRTAAASIASVEARHAAYLNEIMGQVPFPGVTENATEPATIVTQISPFILNCPYSIKTPVPALSACDGNIDENGGSTSSASGSSGTVTGTQTVDSCSNLASVCQLACSSRGVTSCRCTDGFPDIQCGNGVALASSIMMTILFVAMYILV